MFDVTFFSSLENVITPFFIISGILSLRTKQSLIGWPGTRWNGQYLGSALFPSSLGLLHGGSLILSCFTNSRNMLSVSSTSKSYSLLSRSWNWRALSAFFSSSVFGFGLRVFPSSLGRFWWTLPFGMNSFEPRVLEQPFPLAKRIPTTRLNSWAYPNPSSIVFRAGDLPGTCPPGWFE